jgi:hypothetical protein
MPWQENGLLGMRGVEIDPVPFGWHDRHALKLYLEFQNGVQNRNGQTAKIIGPKKKFDLVNRKGLKSRFI